MQRTPRSRSPLHEHTRVTMRCFVLLFVGRAHALALCSWAHALSPRRCEVRASEAASAREVKATPEALELAAVIRDKQAGRSKYKHIVAQTAPSVRVAFSEIFGHAPGAFKADVLVASLKAAGFDLVLDTNTGADLCVCEEGSELLERLLSREAGASAAVDAEPLPLFTSCCPGWMKLVEEGAPELIPYVSTCKSPHMMYGAVLKRFSKELLGCDAGEVYVCSVMPCVRKRGESDRAVFTHGGVRDVDNVITTMDLGMMLHELGIDPTELEPMPYDSPFQAEAAAGSGVGSGAGQLFGVTGGVMEAAVRSVYELVTGAELPRLQLSEVRGLESVREATIPLFNQATGRGLESDLRVAVVHGLGNAKRLVASMESGGAKYDFVEVMACPGGCIMGGGQPRGAAKDTAEQRLSCVYSLDEAATIRRSHENPVVQALYEQHLGGEFGSPQAKDVLHVKQVYGGPAEEHEPFTFGCEPDDCGID